jgi:hypothetical protein
MTVFFERFFQVIVWQIKIRPKIQALREGEPNFNQILMLIPILPKRLPLFWNYFYVNVEKEGENVKIGKCGNVEMWK